jgi:hypothetical protein
MKIKFLIPQSANVIVRWARAGLFTDTLIPRPANNEMLRLTMLQNHKVGHSEIRCVKADRNTMAPQSADLNSLSHRWA